MTTSTPADGPVVLVPRGGAWGERVADLLHSWGAQPWILPMIHTEPVGSPELTAGQAELAAGRYDWVAITSAAAVPALPATVDARIAAVGPATATALREAGYAVEKVPPGPDYSAEAMLAHWHPTGRVLLLHSDLAGPTLADGLREAGAQVQAVVAYRTVATELTAAEAGDLRTGRAAAALATSGSVARALAAAQVAPATRIACLGPRTATVARQCGLEVALIAPQQQLEALVEGLRQLYTPDSVED
ncbi:uroporphyrinogen-III synthase [Ruania zhangjianzhongii]|uniref:uroporphyrinogen-III synthase n=1 Tax=Ruania zhangjianzhongii TaxID=2603206 RepID=UPI0011C768E9|nr:uroporphyrinogen-III synthase [Ruania zhangjianzhongii]